MSINVSECQNVNGDKRHFLGFSLLLVFILRQVCRNNQKASHHKGQKKWRKGREAYNFVTIIFSFNYGQKPIIVNWQVEHSVEIWGIIFPFCLSFLMLN